jgi:hypothetical protein
MYLSSREVVENYNSDIQEFIDGFGNVAQWVFSSDRSNEDVAIFRSTKTRVDFIPKSNRFVINHIARSTRNEFCDSSSLIKGINTLSVDDLEISGFSFSPLVLMLLQAL